jgi:hypothetical protein
MVERIYIRSEILITTINLEILKQYKKIKTEKEIGHFFELVIYLEKNQSAHPAPEGRKSFD